MWKVSCPNSYGKTTQEENAGGVNWNLSAAPLIDFREEAEK